MSEHSERAAAHLAQFEYTATRTGTVFISWNGKTVTTLKGAAAQRFLAQVAEPVSYTHLTLPTNREG